MPSRPPSCGHGRSWERRWHGSPPYKYHAPSSDHKRRFFVQRFVAGLVFFLLLIFGSMGALALIVTQVFGGDIQDLALIWLGGCGLALLLPIIVIGGGIRIYHRYATPLADVMAAADAVADGDLSVRVSETGASELGALARSFNRMTEELERNDQQRRNMTADVAHELRTPLHIIQGNLEGVLDDVYEPTDEHITATLDETRSLARIVDDLQTISLAETGQLPLHFEPVDMGELLRDIATSFGPVAEQDDVTMVVEDDSSDAGLMVEGDPGRLDQVLTNLVANALRHTSGGGTVTLSASADDQTVRVIVADDGDGIDPADLPHIFDRFWRGNRSRSRQDGAGGGLGLAIVRQLVEAHGGEVTVESTREEGSAFFVTLPKRRADERASVPA